MTSIGYPGLPSGGGGMPPGPVPGGPYAGYHFYPMSPTATTSLTFGAVGLGRTMPVLLPSFLLTGIAMDVTTIGDAGSLVRPMIYKDNGNGNPGALVIDVGTFPGDAVALSEIILGTPLLIPGGWYHLGAVGQNYITTAPTVRATAAGTPATGTFSPLATGLPGTGGTATGMQWPGLTGALPASLAAAVSSGPPGGGNPRLIFKVG